MGNFSLLKLHLKVLLLNLSTFSSGEALSSVYSTLVFLHVKTDNYRIFLKGSVDKTDTVSSIQSSFFHEVSRNCTATAAS